VALRVTWIACLANDQVSDAVQYKTLAHNLAQSEGYTLNGRPNAFWPPGYPLFLSLVFRGFPDNEFAGKVANVFFGLGIVLLTYFLGRTLIGETGGRVAAALMAVLPSQIAEVALLRTDNLFLFLFLLLILQILRLTQTASIRVVDATLAGATLGAACLVRPLLLPFPALALAIFLLRGVGWRRAAVLTLAIALGQGLLILPWTLRNHAEFGTFLPVSANSGYGLWMGNNPGATGTYELEVEGHRVHSFTIRQEILRDHQWNDIEADAYFKAVAIDYIAARPDYFLLNGVKKAWHFYALDTDAVSWSIDGSRWAARNSVRLTCKLLAQGAYLALLAVALGGSIVAWSRADSRSRGVRWTLSILILFFTAISIVTVADDRYHIPTLPFICCFAAMWLTRDTYYPSLAISDSGRSPSG
jgi:4-amino-4-deoxy-L-arabinose transferase-like glycosyltransferase